MRKYMTTDNKCLGKNTKTLIRRLEKAFKRFKQENPELRVIRVTRDVYRDYATLGILYHNANCERVMWGNLTVRCWEGPSDYHFGPY